MVLDELRTPVLERIGLDFLAGFSSSRGEYRFVLDAEKSFSPEKSFLHDLQLTNLSCDLEEKETSRIMKSAHSSLREGEKKRSSPGGVDS